MSKVQSQRCPELCQEVREAHGTAILGYARSNTDLSNYYRKMSFNC